MKPNKRTLRTAGTITLALSLAAIAEPNIAAAQTQRRDGERPGRQSWQAPDRQMSDQKLEDWIIVRLANRASYTPGINVDVRDGVVTLSGKVPNEEVKRRAMRIASTTSQVTAVRDELAVDASMRKAEALGGPELAKQVATRIASRIDGAKAGEDWWLAGWRVEGPFNTWSMTVESDEPGRVVLEGDVPKWDVMRKAVEAAANVPGVRVVDSELEYEPDYYPIFRYGAERYYGDGYYPYHPYLARPPYAAPVQPAPMARRIRPAPPVPGDGGA